MTNPKGTKVSRSGGDGIERFLGPNGRRYSLWVQRDLFGMLVIMRVWSGSSLVRGGSKMTTVKSELESEQLLTRIRTVRRNHGYVRVQRFEDIPAGRNCRVQAPIRS